MQVSQLAMNLSLGGLLRELKAAHGAYAVLDHWTQGEFHHDLVLRVDEKLDLPGEFLVVATNCNGGVKEVLSLPAAPTHGALWRHRCPESDEFDGRLPPVLDMARTVHWFDPCDLLRPDARSELKPEFRERQPGGGWRLRSCSAPPEE